jgi:hypothetical protein
MTINARELAEKKLSFLMSYLSALASKKTNGVNGSVIFEIKGLVIEVRS